MNLLAQADALRLPFPSDHFHIIVTSPPYFGLRSYEVAPRVWGGDPACDHEWKTIVKSAANGIVNSEMSGETLSGDSATRKPTFSSGCSKCDAWLGCLGLEPTLDLYLDHMVAICREFRRVLRPDGSFWLNIGDSYNGSGGAGGDYGPGGSREGQARYPGRNLSRGKRIPRGSGRWGLESNAGDAVLKRKDLLMIPARLAIALCEDGWWLRSEIIWSKGNVMPSSALDRPTRSHEQVYLFAKSEHYFYDVYAVLQPLADSTARDGRFRRAPLEATTEVGRRLRSVWTVPTGSYSGDHSASYPPELIEPMILAGTSAKGVCPVCGAPWKRLVKRTKHPSRDMEEQRASAALRTGRADGYVPGPEGKLDEVRTVGWTRTCQHEGEPVPASVLDPFCGTGTTGMVCRELGRNFVGVDLSWSYLNSEARVRALRQTPQHKIDELPLFAGMADET